MTSGARDAKLEAVAAEAVELLTKNHLMLAVAESCTGGMVASAIVAQSGASAVLHEGIVTYSNASKMARLGVKPATLAEFGAVSMQTAKQMAEGLICQNVDISVSTTGVAGPQGGTLQKPVGLVWFALADKNGSTAFSQNFEGTRNEIRVQAATAALEFINNYIKNRNN